MSSPQGRGGGLDQQFRMFMRMQENFSGCRVLSYCFMSNHFHILLEVPPLPGEGLSDEELLKRLIERDRQINTCLPVRVL